MLSIKRYIILRDREYFFPKELRNPKIKMDFYLCHSILPLDTCCQCTKTLVNTIAHVSLMHFSITISHQWKNM